MVKFFQEVGLTVISLWGRGGVEEENDMFREIETCSYCFLLKLLVDVWDLYCYLIRLVSMGGL